MDEQLVGESPCEHDLDVIFIALIANQAAAVKSPITMKTPCELIVSCRAMIVNWFSCSGLTNDELNAKHGISTYCSE